VPHTLHLRVPTKINRAVLCAAWQVAEAHHAPNSTCIVSGCCGDVGPTSRTPRRVTDATMETQRSFIFSEASSAPRQLRILEQELAEATIELEVAFSLANLCEQQIHSGRPSVFLPDNLDEVQRQVLRRRSGSLSAICDLIDVHCPWRLAVGRMSWAVSFASGLTTLCPCSHRSQVDDSYGACGQRRGGQRTGRRCWRTA